MAALAEVAEGQGDRGTAVSFRQQAREVIQFIADYMDDPGLRAGFLGRTAVRKLLAGVDSPGEPGPSIDRS